MSRLAVSAGVLILAAPLLASCGGGDSPTEQAEQGSAGTDAARPAALSEPAVVLPEGSTADPGAMSDFTCAVAADGRWSAAGTLTNTTPTRASFLVTVTVAAPDAAVAGGRQQRVDGLAAGDSVDMRLSRLPAPGGDAHCQLQVLRW